jgi:uroporphyrinogen-III synthase
MPSVGLTSTPERGSRLAGWCIDAGLDPVLLPCIESAPADSSHLAAVRAEARTADWIVVTSRRAISVLWPKGGMPDVRVAAVGPSTAEAVRKNGGNAEVVGGAGAGELTALLADQVRDNAVLFPHASGAGSSTVKALQDAGAEVLARAVYEIRPVAPGAETVDAVAFGSPTAVSGWFLSRSLDGLVVGAIGSTTARALAEHSFEPDVMPPKPSFVGLISSIAECLRDRSPA